MFKKKQKKNQLPSDTAAFVQTILRIIYRMFIYFGALKFPYLYSSNTVALVWMIDVVQLAPVFI